MKALTLFIAASSLAAVAMSTTGAHAADATILSLTEFAERQVARDRLTAELAVEASDPDAARVQAQINRRMTDALARAKAAAGVTVATGAYSVFQEQPSDKAPMRWHGRQSIVLEAHDQAALLALVGTLQADGLALASLNAMLSPDATRAVEDRLTDEALHRLHDRADRIADTLGLKVDRIDKLHVGNAAVPGLPIRFMRAAAAAAPAPSPVAEEGEATVAVSVDAEIALVAK